MQDLEAANVRPLGGFELEEEITEALEVRRAALCGTLRISTAQCIPLCLLWD